MNSPLHHPIPRRTFLRQAGLGLAAASAVGRAAAQGVAPVPRLKIGIVGCGGRGTFLANLFAHHGGYEISALADPFADRTAALAQKFPQSTPRTFHGLQCAQKMIAGGGLDAVAVLSPPYFHPAQARAAVDAGLHVYVAKPVAVDVPGCKSISETGALARKKGLVFLVDFQTRSNEFFVEAVRRAQAGAIGDPCFGEATYHANRLALQAEPGTAEARLRNWVFDRALSGDILVEQNIHSLDVMSWLMGDAPPVRCSGTGGRRVRLDVGDAWDHFALLYEYPNDVGVTFSSRQFDAHGQPGGIENRMFGTKGVFSGRYGGEVLIRGGKDSFYRGGSTSAIYKEGAAANVRDFHARVLAKDASNPTLEPSVTSNLVSIMGRMAAYEHRPVTWTEVLASKQALQANLSGLPA